MTQAPEQVPDLVLERYLLGELPLPQVQKLERRLGQDETLRLRLERLRRSNAEFLQQYPTGWIAGQIRMRAGPPSGSRRAGWWGWTRVWLVPAAAAALVVLVLPQVGQRDRGGDETRSKGDAMGLQLYRQTTAGSERLPDSSMAAPGDRVQIVYRGAGARYGAVFSHDGLGTTTWHLPASGQHAAALPPSGADTLAFAYRLDDAPRWERFYLVTADVQFDLALLRLALQELPNSAGVRLSLPLGFEQHVVTLLKTPGP